MKLTLIIFNYNYCRFLPKLFSSLKHAINNEKINIFFCDDGSKDESVDFVNQYIAENKINNMKIVQVTPAGNRRSHPAYGQMEATDMVLTQYSDELNDYIAFLDSDDWFSETATAEILKEINSTHLKCYFNDLRNTASYDILPAQKQTIKRNIIDIKTKIWPTIVPTSGIVIEKNTLINSKEKLLNKDIRFCDVWLDSRINLFALNFQNEIKYTNIIAYRYIHGSNDSLDFNFKRKIYKQIQASRYYDYIVSKNFRFNTRKSCLSTLDKLLK